MDLYCDISWHYPGTDESSIGCAAALGPLLVAEPGNVHLIRLNVAVRSAAVVSSNRQSVASAGDAARVLPPVE